MLHSARGAVLFAAAVMMVTPARATPDPGDPAFRARVEDIAGFVRLVTGYTWRGPIDIVVRTPAEINLMFYGSHYDGQDERCAADPRAICIKAIAEGGLIILGSDFVPGRDDYVLAHEIAHVMQFHAGVPAEAECLAATEPEAYAVQDAFVAATGRGTASDSLTVLVLSMCPPHY